MDSNSLIILLMLLHMNTKKNESEISYSNTEKFKPINLDGLEKIKNYLSDLKIDPTYTQEKIKIIKKIGPYLPDKYIGLINKSMLHTERIIKINEVLDFLRENKYQYISETIPTKDTKDRISKIVKTIQNEASNSSTKNMGMVMDLIVNMDKYKKIFSVLNSVVNSENPMEDPDKLMNMVLPLLGEDEKNREKLKEMSKMMEIMKVLNTPKQENKTTENKIEVVKNI